MLGAHGGITTDGVLYWDPLPSWPLLRHDAVAATVSGCSVTHSHAALSAGVHLVCIPWLPPSQAASLQGATAASWLAFDSATAAHDVAPRLEGVGAAAVVDARTVAAIVEQPGAGGIAAAELQSMVADAVNASGR